MSAPRLTREQVIAIAAQILDAFDRDEVDLEAAIEALRDELAEAKASAAAERAATDRLLAVNAMLTRQHHELAVALSDSTQRIIELEKAAAVRERKT